MKFFAELHRFLAEHNFPAHERLSVTITVHSASGQARLIDALVADTGAMSVRQKLYAEIQQTRRVASGTAYGIPFTIERRT